MKAARFFIISAGVLLLGCATALLLTNWVTTDFTQPRDPVLQLPIRSLFWITAGLSAIVAFICLFGERISVQTTWVAWLSTTVAVYATGFIWSGARSSRVLWGSFSTAFAVPNHAIDIVMKTMFTGLLAGSYWLLFWIWWRVRQGLPIEEMFLKTSCRHCGGHIAFSVERIGQSIPCPHCHTNTALLKPGNLKMSCYFCNGHIEFPTHALGTKMPCPHCKKDITLMAPK